MEKLLKFTKKNKTAILWVLAIVPFILFYTLPLYLSIVNAFKSTTDIARYPLSIMNITFDNFTKVFSSKSYNILELYRNSMIITATSVAIKLTTGPLAGYFIARSDQRTGRFYTMLFLFAMMIPPQLTLVPLISLYVKLDIIGTYWSIILAYSVNVFVVILYSKFIVTIPISLEEAAYIDGASRLKTFYYIVFPLLKPITATVIILDGIGAWNDFVQPMLLLRSFKTITYGTYLALSTEVTDYGYVFAFVIVASVPLVVLYLFLQKYFIAGLTGGALKS